MNMQSPFRSFTLFYLPLMTCMFYTSSAYYFCWGEVKAKRELMGKIDTEILYDASASMIKKKTTATFQMNNRAAKVVRLSLLATSACWTFPCFFAILLMAASFGVFQGSEDAMEALGSVRVISAMVNPAFGIALFLVIESSFNLRNRYNQSFHQKLRRLRFKLCGPPKRRKRGKHDFDPYDDEKEQNRCVEYVAMLPNTIWQTAQLLIFAPWALFVASGCHSLPPANSLVGPEAGSIS